MSVGEIVFVIGLVAAFIVLMYKTMTLDPKKKPKVWPVYVRIIVIAACIGTLVLVWIIVPVSSWITRIFLTVYPILYIYRALKGWLIRTKEDLAQVSPHSPA